jgi:hypothetical protein
MRIKFSDGTIKEISTPVEQKVIAREGVSSGWIINLAIKEALTSDEIDTLLVPENIASLTLISEVTVAGENGEPDTTTTIEKTLSGYSKMTSCLVRYNENNGISASVELQFSKGL